LDTSNNLNRHRASPIMPGERALSLRQWTPSYRKSLLARFLRGKPIPDCAWKLRSRAIAHMSDTQKVNEQSDHYLTLTNTGVLNHMCPLKYTLK
jgi:hypothetical protein